MMIKYRVHEVAKDFNVPSKQVIDLLAKYFPDPKKHMTALNEEELDIVFEVFTQENMSENFSAYFNSGKSEAAESGASSASENANNTPPAQKERKMSAAQSKDAPRSAEKEKRSAIPFRSKGASSQNRPVASKTQDAGKAAPENKSKADSSSQAPSSQYRTRGDVRRVDTRAANVELEKYNEKYVQMAPSDTMRDQTVNKQKFKNRFQHRRNPYAKRETEAERLKRIALERQKKPLNITIGEEISVGDLAYKLKVNSGEVIKKLMALGVMASINENIDFDTAEIVATELNAKVEREVVVTIEDRIIDDSEDDDKNLTPRSPVVCVMGHVDHGKTSLLDAIRDTSVTETEAGGITQHIGAYRVSVGDKEITFLDTPGHEAFTAMRARGAMATDIAVLVVAADDGIMPQTIEAINHAKAAGVSVIVAINKIDKPGANPDNVLQQLTEHELVPEQWGGDTICVPVSAKKRQNIDKLLETINLVAEIKELKANPNRPAKGIVIEARLDKSRGPIATLLVQNGTLKSSDVIVAGTAVGRVRVMTDDRGRKVDEAGPSIPVEVMGLAETPIGGDTFNAVSDERLARELVEQRKSQAKEEQFNSYNKVTLDNLFSQMQLGEVKELNIIVKADVQGSVEAVKQSLEKLSNDEVRVKVIHGAVGAINESDVMLANVSNAIIVGFNVRPDPVATLNAESEGVDLRTYRVIYDCIEEIESAMKGMLAPKFREVDLGRAEVRQIYKISNIGVIAGCYVQSGKITRNAQIRVVRNGIIAAVDEIDSLRRFKDDVKEVAQNYECGIGLKKYNDIKEGDVFEAFIMEEYRD